MRYINVVDLFTLNYAHKYGIDKPEIRPWRW